MEDTPVRFGDFIIYANGEFEAERPTRGGAKRTIAMLRRLGMSPTVRRHAWTADGRHMNVDCGTKNLNMRPWPTVEVPAQDQPKQPAVMRPSYVEVRREQWPDGSAVQLANAIRVF